MLTINITRLLIFEIYNLFYYIYTYFIEIWRDLCSLGEKLASDNI